MKLRDASVRIAVAIHKAPSTTTSEIMLGRMWIPIRRIGPYPNERPASTKSRCFNTMVGARATRTNGAISVMAIAMIKFSRLAPSMAATIRPRSRVGNESNTSTSPMMKRSNTPPT
ncbi:hypothetical protein D3C72_1894170 [compost metagenome]